MQLNILDEIQGIKLKEAGMLQSITHADEVQPEWSNKAFNVFCDYVRHYSAGKQFQSEDVRQWAYNSKKIEPAPSERAWGSVAQKVARQGLIRKIGHASVSNPKAHSAFATLWQII